MYSDSSGGHPSLGLDWSSFDAGISVSPRDQPLRRQTPPADSPLQHQMPPSSSLPPPSSDTTIDPLRQQFRDAELERAYAVFHGKAYSATGLNDAFFAFILCVTMFIWVVYISARDVCYRCSDKLYAGTSMIVLFVLAVLFVTRVVVGRTLPFLHETVYLVAALVFGAQTIAGVRVCPTHVPATAVGNPNADLPDATFSVMLHIYFSYAFAHFSGVRWPTGAVWIVLATVYHACCLLGVAMFHPLWAVLMPLLILGNGLAIMSAATIGWERRREFVSTLQIESDLRLLAIEKENTVSLASSLFPKHVADRLLQSRKVTTAGGSGSSGNSPATSLGVTPQLGQVIVNSYGSATVLMMRIEGMEDVQPFNIQLELLSGIFIAADHVAEIHHAMKIKSIGVSLLFALGVPKATNDHMSEACQFALDLQRMLRVFKRKKRLSCLHMKIGIATGPVVAGIIGISRPRYDVWGPSVILVDKLASFAPSDEIFVPRDVAFNLKTSFQFKSVKGVNFIHGIGKVSVFRLISTPSTHHKFPIICEPVEPFPKGEGKPIMELAATLRRRALASIPVFPPYRFKKDSEKLYRVEYTAQMVPHLRWMSIFVALALSTHFIVGLVTLEHDAGGIVAECLEISSLLGAAIVSSIPCLARRPRHFWNSITALCLVCVISNVFMWFRGTITDPTASMIVAICSWINHCGLSSARGFFLVLALCLGTMPAFFTEEFSTGTAVIVIATAILSWSMQMNFDRQHRAAFQAKLLMSKYQQALSQEKATSQELLACVVPRVVIPKLVNTPRSLPYITEFSPCGTVLVCRIVGFEAISKTMIPPDIVRMLNSLFSHFDKLCHAVGLEPLKTVVDRYIVVGNLLNEIPFDHCNRVVALAVSMLETLDDFNMRQNYGPHDLSLAIGIHSDSILTGIIRTRSFVFECYGNGIPFAEQICMATSPNTAAVSDSALCCLTSHFTVTALDPMELGGVKHAVYEVIGERNDLSHLTLDIAEGNASESLDTPGLAASEANSSSFEEGGIALGLGLAEPDPLENLAQTHRVAMDSLHLTSPSPARTPTPTSKATTPPLPPLN